MDGLGVLVSFLIGMTKYPSRGNLREEGFLWGHTLKAQVHDGEEDTKARE